MGGWREGPGDIIVVTKRFEVGFKKKKTKKKNLLDEEEKGEHTSR